MNTLFLPELREMLAEDRTDELRDFCTALHPARTAEFMEGLDNEETWRVLQHAQPSRQSEVFQYFDADRQVELIASQDEKQIAVLVAKFPTSGSMRSWRWFQPRIVATFDACKRSQRGPPGR